MIAEGFAHDSLGVHDGVETFSVDTEATLRECNAEQHVLCCSYDNFRFDFSDVLL